MALQASTTDCQQALRAERPLTMSFSLMKSTMKTTTMTMMILMMMTMMMTNTLLDLIQIGPEKNSTRSKDPIISSQGKPQAADIPIKKTPGKETANVTKNQSFEVVNCMHGVFNIRTHEGAITPHVNCHFGSSQFTTVSAFVSNTL